MDAVEVRMRCVEAARQCTQVPQVLEVAEQWTAWILSGRPAAEATGVMQGFIGKVKTQVKELL